MRPVYALLNLVFFYTWKEISAYTPCQESMLTVRYVTSCPTDEVSWKERAGKMNCESIRQNCAKSLGLNTQHHRFQYHCLINSHMNETLEVCALSRYILGFCAEFNTNGALVQENFEANCKQHNPPCPQYYHSAKAYRYQYCYELVYKQRKIQNKKVEVEENDNHTEVFDDAEEIDYAEEIDASEEVDGTGEVNKAVVKGPTAYSNCLTGNRLMLLLLILLRILIT